MGVEALGSQNDLPCRGVYPYNAEWGTLSGNAISVFHLLKAGSTPKGKNLPF